MMKNNPWKELTSNVNLKRCDPTSVFNFFWGINQDGEYLFLLEHFNFEDWPNKKLAFNEIGIEQYQLQSGFRVMLTLKEINDWDIFLILCNDILSLSKNLENEKVLLTMMHNRLQRWQKVFRRVGKKLLSEQEQQGLIGELYFLKEYLFKYYPSEVAVSFWKGPMGDKQDFGNGKNSIEVKTKLGTSSQEIQISSIEQLDFQTQSAFLFVLTILNSLNGDSFTLNSLVKEIKELIKDWESLDLFETLLLEIGYIELVEYDENYYSINKETVYEVSSEFPRLTINNIPIGISNLKYSIDLKSCSKYILENKEFIKRISNV